MRRAGPVLILACILLAFVPRASAVPTARARSSVQRDVALAINVWGDACPTSTVELRFDSQLPPPTLARATWDWPGEGQDPNANPWEYPPNQWTNCLVEIVGSQDWWESVDPARLCHIVVHEWGHLTGHMHVADPHKVMYPYIDHIYPPCRRHRHHHRFG